MFEEMPERNFLNWLRPLVSDKCWDYIILWKLSDDHRCLELMDCMCAGTQNIEGITSPPPAAASFDPPCRDVLFSHPRTKSCDLLDSVPFSMTMDSGVHAEAVMSNNSKWLNFSFDRGSNASEEILGARVLVPLPLGLLELFVAENVPEDEQVIDFIKNQCIMFSDEQALSNSGCTDSSLPVNRSIHEIPTYVNVFQMQNLAIPCIKSSENLYNTSVERIHLAASLFGSLQQLSTSSENKSIFVEGAYDSIVGASGFNEMKTSKCDAMSTISKWMEPSRTLEDQTSDKIPLAEESNRSDCSDPNNDDENGGKYRKRIGKGHQAKNLEAERKRRKKLNDKLYSLRALVPNISKLDRTAILGDAINYVKELQKQVKDLQVELEEHWDDESFPKESSSNGGISEKMCRIEAQVEVIQMDSNELFVKVLCEHRPGAFVRVIEALATLGLQIMNVNVTKLDWRVSNVLIVEKQEKEMIQGDHVKESLARTLG